jgi:hypothetical protein
MQKKILNIFSILFLLIFIMLILNYYTSEKNIIITNKLRSSYLSSGPIDKNKLPLLKSDTNNIVVYMNDLEDFKKKRKKRIWEKLISNQDE